MPRIGAGILKVRYLWAFMGIAGPATNAFGTAGKVWLVPLDISWPVIVDRILYRVGSTQAGNVRVGIYKEGDTEDSPVGAELVVESASIAQAATNVVQLLTIADTVLEPGQYFIGLQGDDTSGTFHRSYDSGKNIATYYNRSGGYGAFTDPCPTLTTTEEGLNAAVRVKEALPSGQRL